MRDHQSPGGARATGVPLRNCYRPSVASRDPTDNMVPKTSTEEIPSTEPVGSPEMPAEMSGIDAIRGKHEWWEANNEVHSVEANGPLLGQDQFAVQFIFDATFKPTGQRQTMTEMALYTVKDGKIVEEQFFYNVPGK
jgi:ketosteroid isomerase-like protein